MAQNALLATVAAATLLSACYSTGDGPQPPSETLYYPTAVAVSPGGNALYIANSDFDLQYNGGTVQTIDLGRVRQILTPLWDVDRWAAIASASDSASGAEPTGALCAAAHLAVNANPVSFPGPCEHVDLNAPPDDRARPLVASPQGIARIGAFATKLLYVCQPEPGQVGVGARCEGDAATRARLFAVVRGDPSLTYFEVDDDRAGGVQNFNLDCGQATNSGACNDAHRLGTDPNDNSRELELATEPFDEAVSDGAEAIAISHQSSGMVSVFTVPGSGGQTILDTKPTLQYTLALGSSPAMGIAALPIPALARTPNPGSGQPDLLDGVYKPGFLVDFRSAAQVAFVRFFGDTFSSPNRPYLTLELTSTIPISVNASGADSRGVAIDRAPREACEAGCAASSDLRQCLTDCARVPMPVYVVNRSPSTLIIGETATQSLPGGILPLEQATVYNELVRFYDSVPLSAGPSRIVLGTIRTKAGTTERRVFVVCFDARIITVYDPVRRTVEAQIFAGRGPQDLVLDPVLPLAYVAHFTDSYIGVIDLDQSHPVTFETMIAGVGLPVAPEVSK